ncbi:MAG: DNA polymerase I [Nitrospinae bacterium RIFCSPLOWO2_02_FULL_39_110]|nr:MAG: DNA polymerase I [Nitrospinae bacterium RIFCSPHIGHO2_12_FULL_39_42]OGW01816.1 MAG: DNA polymerase I [Nitrospinae bacterium RIFCSPLOWO2_02_39_17]OGW02913.1 MAG: DNA polymerase I [Nitrospinae bacterium RIFCSPHIGHO2_02_FULL_39_82]OGW07496.1 MAG: DNA polymerase I [Nitrospinae bacterium RIFCSPLOWO2_02_FULL_39_110]OGW07777.1 MAG: DNA polymerase I [Nitrospinae bacterium RIFCSPLOWO2_12_39_15]OGW07977.1 MAG: DNA polymerase I [Nitrospinae bacterium RIFCSPLOWO2_12_FULL_39_93]HLA47983.1 DNA polym
MQKRSKLYLIDGSSYIYRAFYAIPHLSNSKGHPTNAIYGFARMILKVIRDEKPDYIAVVFDSKGETFRHKEYADYKSHRPEMPEELAIQIPFIQKLVQVFNISILHKEGYEADDIIGSAVRIAEDKGFDVTIVSGDKDMLQLVTPNVRMLDTLKGKVYGEREVIEKFGVEPDKVVEVLGLMGDASDNIPGIPGIGEKTASSLIKEFTSIENLLKNVEDIKKDSLKEKIKSHAEQALLSRRLSIIKRDIELDVPVDALILKDIHYDDLTIFFRELEFYSLLKDIMPRENIQSGGEYRAISDVNDFERLLERITVLGAMAIDLEATSEDPVKAEIVGISISIKPRESFYIPVGHSYIGASPQLDKRYVMERLKPLMESEEVKKYGHNIKYASIVLSNEGLDLKGIEFDTMIAAYLINPSKSDYSLGRLALDYLDYQIGERKGKRDFSLIPIPEMVMASCEETDIVFQLKEVLESLLKEDKLTELYYSVELPLVKVLVDMERKGVRIDESFLRDMSKRLDRELSKLIEQIYFIAGGEFNINSSKQLQDVLFERLKLKSIKRTKTGLSTDMEVLQQLAVQHEFPAKILEYRQLSKLKSTYVDALSGLINPKTGRVHTSFNQTVTATGRLSSSNPNLQNIPVRTELGREIRKAFIPESGCTILSADYSQIELRILAHVSADEVLIDAFKRGEDIHEWTACEVFGVIPGMVTSDMRRMAKAVNFGIIYGISPFGLSRDMGVSNEEAKKFIESYFNRYKRVKEYIDRTLNEAYEKGYVTTILQRRRYLPDLKRTSPLNPPLLRGNKGVVREFAERAAINTSIQGSAADMIKVAMINIHRRIKKEMRRAEMIIQIHDELVFEVIDEEVEALRRLVKEEMEGVMKLSVPIIVEINTGKNWNEAH